MTAQFCPPAFAGLRHCTQMPGKNGRRSQDAASKVVGRRAPLWGAAVKTARWGLGFVRAGYSARFGLHQIPDDVGVVPPIESKAVCALGDACCVTAFQISDTRYLMGKAEPAPSPRRKVLQMYACANRKIRAKIGPHSLQLRRAEPVLTNQMASGVCYVSTVGCLCLSHAVQVV